MRSSRLLKGLLVALFVAALCVGIGSMFNETQAKGPCICPKIYAPVQCDNGKIYPNQCEADCRHARNCVPVGTLGL